MTTLQRTAYPTLDPEQKLSVAQLEQEFRLKTNELTFIKQHVRGKHSRLTFAVHLKVFQYLGYFINDKKIPAQIIQHIQDQFPYSSDDIQFGYQHKSLQYRHRELVYKGVSILPWKIVNNKHQARRLAIQFAHEAAQHMNFPVDIINVVIEKCHAKKIELPKFSELDRLVRHTKSLVNRSLFTKIYHNLNTNDKAKLDALLVLPDNYGRTQFNDLKGLPHKPTVTNIRKTIAHMEWLKTLGDHKALVSHFPTSKAKQFCNEIKSLDADSARKISTEKRYALMTCLCEHAKETTYDAMGLMIERVIAGMHKKAKTKLVELREQHVQQTEQLLTTFSLVLEQSLLSDNEEEKIDLQEMIEQHGGASKLYIECTEALACNSRHHHHLLFEFYKKKRSVLFLLLRTCQPKPTMKHSPLAEAVSLLLENQDKKASALQIEVDLSFTNDIWRKYIAQNQPEGFVDRRYFEMCVFSHVAEQLRCGDLFIEGSDSYRNYLASLLPWKDCLPLLEDYCQSVELPTSGKLFVTSLEDKLTNAARELDNRSPRIDEMLFGENNRLTLKKREPKIISSNTKKIIHEIKRRMPERDVIGLLCNTQYYAHWADELGPLSGNEAKLNDPVKRYVQTTFAYGSSIGPTEASRHFNDDATAHILSNVNRRHVSPEILDKARTKLINYFRRLPMTLEWGHGKACGADGSLCEVRDDNLMAEFHFRYKKKGGIAYHHIADNYIALFSTFIPCGVWEAVAIIEALLKNDSDVKPDVIHADTQGQSTVVFALAYLLGIKLMPRIRGWKDLVLYRPTKNTRYKNIDTIFTGTVDWELIENHWQEMMKLVLSIKAGRIDSTLILRKLGTYSRKNTLYLALQELGRVIRTIFLLEYIGSVEVREVITEMTNKVEAYHTLRQWTQFGSNVLVASNDAIEMEKAIKYNDLITNSIMLQNVIDMSQIVEQLIAEGYDIGPKDIARLSPYWTEHLKRFGLFVVNLENKPEDIEPEKLGVLKAS